MPLKELSFDSNAPRADREESKGSIAGGEGIQLTVSSHQPVKV